MPKFKLEIIRGVEGPCISLNDYRIAGPKPWGGGTVTKSFTVDVDDLVRAIPGLIYTGEEEEDILSSGSLGQPI
jgi:hypothetical protein